MTNPWQLAIHALSPLPSLWQMRCGGSAVQVWCGPGWYAGLGPGRLFFSAVGGGRDRWGVEARGGDTAFRVVTRENKMTGEWGGNWVMLALWWVDGTIEMVFFLVCDVMDVWHSNVLQSA